MFADELFILAWLVTVYPYRKTYMSFINGSSIENWIVIPGNKCEVISFTRNRKLVNFIYIINGELIRKYYLFLWPGWVGVTV